MLSLQLQRGDAQVSSSEMCSFASDIIERIARLDEDLSPSDRSSWWRLHSDMQFSIQASTGAGLPDDDDAKMPAAGIGALSWLTSDPSTATLRCSPTVLALPSTGQGDHASAALTAEDAPDLAPLTVPAMVSADKKTDRPSPTQPFGDHPSPNQSYPSPNQSYPSPTLSHPPPNLSYPSPKLRPPRNQSFGVVSFGIGSVDEHFQQRGFSAQIPPKRSRMAKKGRSHISETKSKRPRTNKLPQSEPAASLPVVAPSAKPGAVNHSISDMGAGVPSGDLMSAYAEPVHPTLLSACGGLGDSGGIEVEACGSSSFQFCDGLTRSSLHGGRNESAFPSSALQPPVVDGGSGIDCFLTVARHYLCTLISVYRCWHTAFCGDSMGLTGTFGRLM